MLSYTVPPHMRRFGLEPDPALADLRERSPVTRLRLPNGMRVWLVTSHQLVRQIFGDPDTFGSNGEGWTDPANGGPVPTVPPVADKDLHGDLTQYDPPEHTRLRRLLVPAFGAARVKALRPAVKRIIDGCLDGMASATGPVNLVEFFAMPVPLLVICELLKIPYADQSQFRQRSLDRLDNSLPQSVRTAAVRDSREYMVNYVAGERRAPGDGVIGNLVREHGDELSDHELVGVADILLLGGYETTANMLGLGTYFLLGDRERWAAVRAGENIEGVVEELLRYLCPVATGMIRVAHRDVVLAGTQVRAGERLLCSLPSGNRDPAAVGACPEAFDPTRNNSAHLSFGYGIHYCLGSSLARMEMRLAYTALARRFPELRLVREARAEEFRPHTAVYGIDTVLVEW